MFVETLPLRLSFDESQTFAELLQGCKAVMKAGLCHAKTSGNEYFTEIQRRGVDLRALTSFSIVDNGCAEALGKMEVGLETDVPFHVRVNLNQDNRLGLRYWGCCATTVQQPLLLSWDSQGGNSHFSRKRTPNGYKK